MKKFVYGLLLLGSLVSCCPKPEYDEDWLKPDWHNMPVDLYAPAIIPSYEFLDTVTDTLKNLKKIPK
jgi:hypothetical protein